MVGRSLCHRNTIPFELTVAALNGFTSAHHKFVAYPNAEFSSAFLKDRMLHWIDRAMMKQMIARMLLLFCAGAARSQTPAPPSTINLQDALARARQYGGQIQSANLAALLAREDRAQ